MTPERVQRRVLANVTVQEDGCIVSNYSTGSHGYSQVGWQDNGVRTVTVGHRVAWEAAHGPIPDGLTVDHLCRNRRCVNVDHLRLLSNRVNATLNGNSAKDRCKRGHEFTPENTRLVRHRSGRIHRRCRTCEGAYNARRAG